ncbi:hypothetical protein DXV65_17585 [Pseudomonas fluorescens]|nr:hypothetical protein DXV65_17585 [Pseudomonas fluorescens]
MWERACPRRRQTSHPLQQLTHRFREQARSHSCDCCLGWIRGAAPTFERVAQPDSNLEIHPKCGSGLARECGRPVTLSSD